MTEATTGGAVMIDAHAHVFPRAADAPRRVDELAPAERAAPLDAYRRLLDAAGIAGAVLVPLDDEHDAYVADAVRAQPGTFAAVAVATRAEQGRSGVDPVEALRRRRDAFPFLALRTMWLGEPGRSLRDSPMFPVLRHLSDVGVAIWSYLPPGQAAHLDELGELLPDLVVVLNHLGFAPHDMVVDEHRRPRFTDPLPEAELVRIERLAVHRSFQLMFSGHYALAADPYPYVDLHASTRRLVSAFTAARTLWGSDSPWINDVPGYPATHGVVDAIMPDLSATERADILGGTLSRVLSFVPYDRR